MTEYTYITSAEGLLFDVKGARGIKSGYSLIDLNFEKTGTCGNGQWKKIRLYMMYRGAIKSAIVVEFSDPSGFTYKCICAPKSAPLVTSKCLSDFDSLVAEWNYVLSAAFVNLASRKLF